MEYHRAKEDVNIPKASLGSDNMFAATIDPATPTKTTGSKARVSPKAPKSVLDQEAWARTRISSRVKVAEFTLFEHIRSAFVCT